MTTIPRPDGFHCDHDKHRYTLNGKRLPSVTTITGVLDKSGGLVPWASKQCGDYTWTALTGAEPGEWPALIGSVEVNVDGLHTILAKARDHHRSVKQKAGKKGTNVHDACEAWLTGNPWDITAPTDPEEAAAWTAFTAWWRDTGGVRFDVVATEVTVLGPAAAYAGRFDLLLRDKQTGHLTLGDFKTSKGIYSEAFMQTAAYAMALGENHDTQVVGTMIIHLPKTGEPAREICRSLSEWYSDYRAFEHCLGLYRAKSDMEKTLRAWRKLADATTPTSTDQEKAA